jgi:hypothetical protein
MTPNQTLEDIMTDDAYRNDDEMEEKKEKKDEKKDEKKKSVAFKATSSLKGKGKQGTSSEDDDSSFDDMNDARKKKSSSKNKKESRRCFKYGSKDHLVAQCPYNSGNDDDDKKSKKDKKKKKKEKKDKMTIKIWVVHMWSLGIVMLPQVMMMIVMMTRPPRRVMQALPYKRSLLSSTLHHSSWLRPLK